MNSITKIIANHFAIVIETPEINPNPNALATIAIIRNIIAHANQLVTPFLSIFLQLYKVVGVYSCMCSEID